MGWQRWLLGDRQTRRRVERQVRDELQGHLEQLVSHLQRSGMSEAQARREARDRFGDLDAHLRVGRNLQLRALRAASRAEHTRGWLHDLRWAYRALAARPGFTLAAAAMLGIGVGAATLMSSLVHTVLLRPLPFESPGQLFHIDEAPLTTAFAKGPMLAPEDVLDWRPRVARAFSDVAAYHPLPYSVNLAGLGGPVEAGLTEVSTNFFAVLGQRTVLGRTFTAADLDSGPRPMVIGERLWRNHWGADREIVGKEVLIDGRPHRIVGVVPSLAQLPADVDVWVAMGLSWEELFVDGARFFNYVGRLRPGVGADLAQADLRELRAYLSSLREGYDPELGLTPLHDDLVAGASSPLWLLSGGVATLLLIALANLAGHLLVRSRARESELAVRAALGAGRRRLLQQSLAESFLLALGAAAVASLLASWSVGLVRGSGLPLARLDSLAVDWRLFAIALIISLLCALAFGVWPALRASRPDLLSALGATSRSTPGGRRRSREILVIAQIALALVLAAGAGVLVRSYERLEAVDNGFGGEVLTFALRLDDGTLPTWAEAAELVDTLGDRLRRVPGVEAAGASTLVPLANRSWFGIRFEVEGEPADEGRRRFATYSTVTPGFLEAMGIDLRAGRMITQEDGETAPLVVVVNEAFVRAYFGAVEPAAAVGRRIVQAGPADGKTYTIAGVVADVRRRGPASDAESETYLPFAQAKTRPGFFALRTAGDVVSVSAAVRRIVGEVAPALPVYDLRLMRDRLGGALMQPRVLAWLFTAFGVASVLLASFGLYVTVAHWVASRTHELGVRMAIGATRSGVFARLLRDGALRLAAGLALGFTVYAVAARGIDRELLFGTGVYEPGTLVTVGALLCLATLAGIVVAAARALRLDPVRALRAEVR